LGKIANLTDAGMPVYVFTGNHDMWMFDYLPKEIGVKIFRNPISCIIGDKKFFLGHGDGLGPGDRSYKLIKWVFANKFFQWIFSIAPPILGFGIANKWSKKSRLLNHGSDQKFLGNNEWLFQFCNETDAQQKHDYYIFGHRHLPLNMVLHSGAVYFNLGEWVNHFTYAQFDGERVELKKFE
jgi:UDP-2,3-diacylglucosamine hydrolase